MRKKGKAAHCIPEGTELMDYLNQGTPTPNQCGSGYGSGKKIPEVDVIFTPAHRADGRLMKWSMST